MLYKIYENVKYGFIRQFSLQFNTNKIETFLQQLLRRLIASNVLVPGQQITVPGSAYIFFIYSALPCSQTRVLSGNYGSVITSNYRW